MVSRTTPSERCQKITTVETCITSNILNVDFAGGFYVFLRNHKQVRKIVSI